MNLFIKCMIGLSILLANSHKIEANLSSSRINGTKTEPGFVLVAPSRFIAGVTSHFCLYLPPQSDGETSYKKMLLELRPLDEEQPSYVSKEFQMYNLGCFDFAIPLNSEILKIGANPDRAKLILHLEQENSNVLLSREVWIIGDPYETVIQTDRAVYKPGDIVRIRAMTFSNQFTTLDEPFSLIWLENPTGVRIAQWRNVSTQRGLAELHFQLSFEPLQGTWKLFTRRSIHERSASFRVEEYILPRYEVQLKGSEYLIQPNLTGSWEICAKYTFGKPVQGVAHLKISHNRNLWEGGFDEKFETSAKLINGCANININLIDHINLTLYYYVDLESSAYVIEENTNIRINASKKVLSQITAQTYKFEMDKYSSNHYQIGLPYSGQLVATNLNGEPAMDKFIQLCVKQNQENVYTDIVVGCQNYTTDQQGSFTFKIAPPVNSTGLTLIASEVRDIPDEKSSWPPIFRDNKIITYHSIRPWYSPSGSFIRSIQPKLLTQPLQCGKKYSFSFDYTNPDKLENIDFIYLIQSRGEIIETGQISSTFSSSLSEYLQEKSFVGNITDLVDFGRITIDLPITANYTPQASILIYYIRTDFEIVTSDSYNFVVSPCLEDKVNAWWVNRNRIPGSNALLRISTPIPNSLCSLSVIDKSSELLKTNNDKAQTRIDRNLILNVFHRLEDPIIYTKNDNEYCQKQIQDNYFYSDSPYSDASQSFVDFHSTVFTNLIYETKPCHKRAKWILDDLENDYDIAPRMMQQHVISVPLVYAAPRRRVSEVKFQNEGTTVRTFFPETWLWENFNTGPDGSAQLERSLPHSITQWVGHLFCLSSNGALAVAPPLELVTFQPFFLEYLTPYSIKRNEVVNLKTIIFNFLNHSLPVHLEYWGASGLELLSNSSIRFCIPPGQNYIHNFKVRAFDIGELNTTVSAGVDDLYPEPCGPEVVMYKRDVLIKPILVKPEGFPVEKDFSKLACPSERSEDSINIFQLTLPNEIIEDSARGGIAISSDIMGPTLMNLDNLVRLPTGCGEQNMILLAPNVQVIYYLENIRKVNPQLKNRAINFIKKGYQGQQNYKHKDGSYSAFGPRSDVSGSIWLTAFVVKTFSQARRYTFIDRKHLDQSIKWIVSQQLENGCFPKIGQVFDSTLKGGLSDSSTALTSYILIAILDSDFKLKENVIENAKRCLVSNNDEDDLYALALKLYAFALINENELVDQYIEHLMSFAKRENDLLFWESRGNLGKSIEMSAYIALMLMRMNPGLTGEVTSIIRWISLQRNSNGGFQSTQDTVIGLEAIATFASRLSIDKNKPIFVNINAEDLNETVNITSYNRQLVHQFNVPVLPTQVSFNIEGTDCVLLQSWIRYNTPVTFDEELFTVHTTLKAIDDNQNTIQCSKVEVKICLKFKPIGKETNMALLEVEMVSGYSPDKLSVAEFAKQNKDIKRWEYVRDQLIFYFDDIGNEEKCVRFQLDQTSVVENPMEAMIHVYDYYNQEISYKKGYSIHPDDCFFNNIQNNTTDKSIEDQSESFRANIASASPFRNTVEISRGENTTRIVDLSSLLVSTTSEMPLVFNLNLNSSFTNVDHELETPKGQEGPSPVIILPDGSPLNEHEEKRIINQLMAEKDCPQCWNKLPLNLTNVYCDSDIIFKLIIDQPNEGRIVFHIKPSPPEDKNQTSIRVTWNLDSECKCDPIFKVNGHVVIFAKGDEIKTLYNSSNEMLNLTFNNNISLSAILKRKAMKRILSYRNKNCEKESLSLLNPVNLNEE